MKHLLYYKESISDLRSIEDEVKSLYYILEDENITIDDEFKFTTSNTTVLRIYFQPNWISTNDPKYVSRWTEALNNSNEFKEFLCRIFEICNNNGFYLYQHDGRGYLNSQTIEDDRFKMVSNYITIQKKI